MFVNFVLCPLFLVCAFSKFLRATENEICFKTSKLISKSLAQRVIRDLIDFQVTDSYCYVTFADHESAKTGLEFLDGRQIFCKVFDCF